MYKVILCDDNDVFETKPLEEATFNCAYDTIYNQGGYISIPLRIEKSRFKENSPYISFT